MDRFEFFMTIAGVAVAIGVTEIVGGWGRLLRSQTPIKADWLHLGWCLVLITWPIMYWIGMWAYRDVEFVVMGQVLMLFIPTLLAVLAQYAITPVAQGEKTLSLRNHYLAKRRLVFLPFGMFLVMSYVADLVIVGTGAAFDPASSLTFVMVPLVLASAVSRALWLHTLTLVVIGFFVALFTLTPISGLEARFAQ